MFFFKFIALPIIKIIKKKEKKEEETEGGRREGDQKLLKLLPSSLLLPLMPLPSSEPSMASTTSCQPGPAGCTGPLFFLVSALWENRLPTQQN